MLFSHHTAFEIKKSGRCNLYITSMAECSQAAKALGFSDTSASDDGQNNVSYDPKGCYYEGSSLKLNSRGTNTGSCTSSDQCLCKLRTSGLLLTIRYLSDDSWSWAKPHPKSNKPMWSFPLVHSIY